MKFAVLIFLFSSSAFPLGNETILNFREAKKILPKIFDGHETTIYCPCTYKNKVIDLKSCGYKIHKDEERAQRLEWEHVVPAEAFGQSFVEWRDGGKDCIKKNGKKFKGRKCAEKNPKFSKMEADLYNLWPVIGELNGLRSNYSMAQIAGDALSFGGCKAKIQDRKFEPMDESKGIVARVYLYMEKNYPGHGIVSNKNEKLYAAWDKLFPVTQWECERSDRIQKIQGNVNEILKLRCEELSKKKATMK